MKWYEYCFINMWSKYTIRIHLSLQIPLKKVLIDRMIYLITSFKNLITFSITMIDNSSNQMQTNTDIYSMFRPYSNIEFLRINHPTWSSEYPFLFKYKSIISWTKESRWIPRRNQEKQYSITFDDLFLTID